jgi:hypothetical protein
MLALFTADGQIRLHFQEVHILRTRLQQAAALMMRNVQELFAMVTGTPTWTQEAHCAYVLAILAT